MSDALQYKHFQASPALACTAGANSTAASDDDRVSATAISRCSCSSLFAVGSVPHASLWGELKIDV